MRWKWSQAECWHDSFVIFQWIQTSIAKELKSSLMFQGVGLDPLFPHLDPRMNSPIVTVMVILTLFYDQWKKRLASIKLERWTWNLFICQNWLHLIDSSTRNHHRNTWSFLWRTEIESLNHSCTSKSCKRKEKKKKKFPNDFNYHGAIHVPGWRSWYSVRLRIEVVESSIDASRVFVLSLSKTLLIYTSSGSTQDDSSQHDWKLLTGA